MTKSLFLTLANLRQVDSLCYSTFYSSFMFITSQYHVKNNETTKRKRSNLTFYKIKKQESRETNLSYLVRITLEKKGAVDPTALPGEINE